ncbi:hypothetical protein TNCV_2260251 [Trichonephila clavipes]|nr:hypothetical protein TNCV_2260251 [Trichonephila clavipes]
MGTSVLAALWGSTLAAYKRQFHTGPSPGVTVWDAIGYAYRSRLVRIEGTLKSARYISGVLYPCNGLSPGEASSSSNRLKSGEGSPDLSAVEKVWSMVSERLARHHTPVITVDEL